MLTYFLRQLRDALVYIDLLDVPPLEEIAELLPRFIRQASLQYLSERNDGSNQDRLTVVHSAGNLGDPFHYVRFAGLIGQPRQEE
jgi:hypothetical protein